MVGWWKAAGRGMLARTTRGNQVIPLLAKSIMQSCPVLIDLTEKQRNVEHLRLFYKCDFLKKYKALDELGNL